MPMFWVKIKRCALSGAMDSVLIFRVSHLYFFKLNILVVKGINIKFTIFDLITAHTPISAPLVKQFHSLQITASVLFVSFFRKVYVVGTHNICIYKENQKNIQKYRISLGSYIFLPQVFPAFLKNLSAPCST